MSEPIAAYTVTNHRKEWTNLIVKLRRQIRRLLKQQKEVFDQRHSLKDSLAVETAKTFKNRYQIAEMQGKIAKLDSVCEVIENELAALGGFLFKVLPMYENSGASDHDFAQLIGCNAKRMERIRADFDNRDREGRSFFVDAVFIHHAEQPIERENEPFVIFSDLPFFDAMTFRFMKVMDFNPKMRKAVHDAMDEILPELRAHQYIAKEAPNGEITLEKYYPPLKLMR